MKRIPIERAALILLATGVVQAQEHGLPAPPLVAGELRYEVIQRDMELGRWPDVVVHSSVEIWQVAEPAADDSMRVRMQREQCSFDEEASTPDPELHARLREVADILCGQPVDMRLDPDGSLSVLNIAQLGDAVRRHLATALAPSGPAGAGLEPAFVEETIDAVANNGMIESDIKHSLERIRLPTLTVPAVFTDERPNPLEDTLIHWDHRVTRLPDDGSGPRLQWTAQPDTTAVQASLQALAGPVGVTPGATHNLGRALAGDRELGVTREYRLDPAGRVLDSTTVTVRRLGESHQRSEESVRLLGQQTPR